MSTEFIGNSHSGKTKLWFAEEKDGEFGLTLVSFFIPSQLSATLNWVFWVTTTEGELDFDKIVNRGAGFTLVTPYDGTFVFSGVVREVELEEEGEETRGDGNDNAVVAYSRYKIVIEPWLAHCDRVTTRVFQNMSRLDCVLQVAKENGLVIYEAPPEKKQGDKSEPEPLFRPRPINPENYPKLPFIMQYRQSDKEFIECQLSQLGIHYYFHVAERSPESATNGRNLTTLVLEENPQLKKPIAWPALKTAKSERDAGEFPYLGEHPKLEPDELRYCSKLSLSRRAGPRRVHTRFTPSHVDNNKDVDRPDDVHKYYPSPKDNEKDSGATRAKVPSPLNMLSGSSTGGASAGVGPHAHGKMGAGRSEDYVQYFHLGECLTVREGANASSLAGSPIHGQQTMGASFDPKEAEAIAARTLEAIVSGQSWVRFTTNVPLQPGMTFKVGHEKAPPGYAYNYAHPWLKRTLIVVYSEGHGEMDTFTWEVVAFFADEPCRARLIREPRLDGFLTGVVVGGDGADEQENHCDGLGRVRVQLYCDLEGHFADSTCWLRVLHSPFHRAVPRPPDQVLIGSLHNVNELVVLGVLYNAQNPPPFHEHPHARDILGIKSDHVPHKGKQLGFSSIYCDDTVDNEGTAIGGLSIQADPDLKIVIKNRGVTSAGTEYEINVGNGSTVRITKDQIQLTTGESDVIISDKHIHMASQGTICLHAAQDLKIQSKGSILLDADKFIRMCEGAAEEPALGEVQPAEPAAPSFAKTLPGTTKPQVNCQDYVLPGTSLDVKIGPREEEPRRKQGPAARASQSISQAATLPTAASVETRVPYYSPATELGYMPTAGSPTMATAAMAGAPGVMNTAMNTLQLAGTAALAYEGLGYGMEAWKAGNPLIAASTFAGVTATAAPFAQQSAALGSLGNMALNVAQPLAQLQMAAEVASSFSSGNPIMQAGAVATALNTVNGQWPVGGMGGAPKPIDFGVTPFNPSAQQALAFHSPEAMRRA